MARARYLKPSFFTNDRVGKLAPLTRLAWQGLWCHADREGRLKDRPARLKVEVLPYDDVDFDELLAELADAGFIVRYQVAGERFIAITSWAEHQQPHYKEVPSLLPSHNVDSSLADVEPTLIHPRRNHPTTLHPESESESESESSTESESESETTTKSVVVVVEPPPDDDLADCIRAWERSTGALIVPLVADKMADWLTKVPKDWVIDAIEITGKAGKKAWSYTEGILQNWTLEGRDVDQPEPENRFLATQKAVATGREHWTAKAAGKL